MLTKVLGLVLIALGLSSAYYFWEIKIETSEPIPSPTLYKVITTDLERLSRRRILPPQWSSIRSVAYNFKSDQQRQLFGEIKLPINERPNGDCTLEIEFIDVPDKQRPSLILQMSLTDFKTKNKIWELGRTYNVHPYIEKADRAGD